LNGDSPLRPLELDQLPRRLMRPARSPLSIRSTTGQALWPADDAKSFEREQESQATRDRYGDTHWGKSLLTARRMIEVGVRVVQCSRNSTCRRIGGPGKLGRPPVNSESSSV